jgi:hypothetical protein
MISKPHIAVPLILLALCGCGVSSVTGTFREPGAGSNNNPNNGGTNVPVGNPLLFANPRTTPLLAAGSASPTRLVAVPLSPIVFGATVRGFRNGPNQGRVVALPQLAAATSGIIISADGLGNVGDMTNPFALERVNAADLLVTDQVTTSANGRLILVSQINTVTALATHTQLGPPTLRGPIDVTTSGTTAGVWVAEYRAANDGGCVRIFNPGNNTFDVFANGLSFPSSVAFVRDSGRNLLYIAENGSGAVSGASGGILRLDLATFVPGSTVAAGNPGVTIIQPRTGDPAYSHPFDLAPDSGFASGNLVVTEGLTMNLSSGVFSQDGTGSIRAIPSRNRTESDRSRVIQSNLVAPRGPWMTLFTDSNQIYTTFADGLAGNGNVRSASFNFVTGTVANQAILANAQNDVLDTFVDPAVPSLRFTVNSNGSNAGQVIDLRNGN